MSDRDYEWGGKLAYTQEGAKVAGREVTGETPVATEASRPAHMTAPEPLDLDALLADADAAEIAQARDDYIADLVAERDTLRTALAWVLEAADYTGDDGGRWDDAVRVGREALAAAVPPSPPENEKP